MKSIKLTDFSENDTHQVSLKGKNEGGGQGIAKFKSIFRENGALKIGNRYIDFISEKSKANGNKSQDKFEQCVKLATIKERIPTHREFIKMGISTSKMKSYISKLLEMGYSRKTYHSLIKDEDLLKELSSLYKRTGMLPGAKIIREFSSYSYSAYVNHFGNFSNAVTLMLQRYHKRTA